MALVSHAGHLHNAYLFVARTGINSNDRMVSAMPLFHVAGCVGDLLTMLVTGGVPIPLISFDPAKELELLSLKQTLYVGVPTFFPPIFPAKAPELSRTGLNKADSPVA